MLTIVGRSSSHFTRVTRLFAAELARSAPRPPAVLWPEALDQPLLANAQELTLQGMATEVSLIMAQLSGAAPSDPLLDKQRASLTHVLGWLDTHVVAIAAALPAERELSFLELSLYCFVTHLEFREVVPLDDYRHLRAFCAAYGSRPAALQTPYRFDR